MDKIHFWTWIGYNKLMKFICEYDSVIKSWTIFTLVNETSTKNASNLWLKMTLVREKKCFGVPYNLLFSEPVVNKT